MRLVYPKCVQCANLIGLFVNCDHYAPQQHNNPSSVSGGVSCAFLVPHQISRLISWYRIIRHAIKSQNTSPIAPSGWWEEASYELFSNLGSLYEAIDTFFSLRAAQEGYPAMLVFCVYICGSLASYLWKWPSLCPSLSSRANKILQRSLEVLGDLNHAWPQARTWLEALRKVSVPLRTPKGQDRPLREMSSQERFLTDVVSSKAFSENDSPAL